LAPETLLQLANLLKIIEDHVEGHTYKQLADFCQDQMENSPQLDISRYGSSRLSAAASLFAGGGTVLFAFT